MVEMRMGSSEETKRLLGEFSLNEEVFRRDILGNSQFIGQIVAIGGERVLAVTQLITLDRTAFWNEVLRICQESNIDIRGVYTKPVTPTPQSL